MTAPTQPEPPSGSSKRTGTIIAIVAAVLIIGAGAVAWWLTTKDDGSPVATPSPSPSASASPSPSPSPTPSPSVSSTPSPSATAASMEDMNGRWCSTAPDASPDDCVTVNLPNIVWDGHEDQEEFVYPLDADPSADPATFDYSGPPNSGGCWLGAIDVYPASSGAPLMYCPAGADGASDDFNDWTDMAGPIDQDRLWPGFQEPSDPSYVRADG